MKKKYKRFKHDLEYKEGYCERILYILLILLILDIILLYIVW